MVWAYAGPGKRIASRARAAIAAAVRMRLWSIEFRIMPMFDGRSDPRPRTDAVPRLGKLPPRLCQVRIRMRAIPSPSEMETGAITWRKTGGITEWMDIRHNASIRSMKAFPRRRKCGPARDPRMRSRFAKEVFGPAAIRYPLWRAAPADWRSRSISDKLAGHGSTHAIRSVRRDCDAGLLRVGRPQPLVRAGVRRIVRVGFGLWLPSRGLALRRRRSHLVPNRKPPLVDAGLNVWRSTAIGEIAGELPLTTLASAIFSGAGPSTLDGGSEAPDRPQSST